MKKPNPKAYGKDNELWEKGGKEAYEKAYLKWVEYRTKYGSQSGRVRLRPIHPSWEPVLQNFDSTDPQRSQGAFCRWANLNRGTFSAMQIKPIKPEIEKLINKWLYVGDGQGLDGSMNTNQDRT